MAKKNDPNRPDSFLGRFVRFIIGAPTYDEWFGKSGKLAGAAESFVNQQTGAHLTGAQTEANAFTAEQAQLNRDWQTEMSNTAYQRQVADMRAAGVNPALAMQSASGAVTPSGASGASVSPSQGASMSDLMQAMLLKKQGKLLDAQAKQAKDSGTAALRQAGAAEKNAGAAEKNADTNVFNAETNRIRANNEIRIGNSTIELNSATMDKIAQDIQESVSRIELQDLEKLAKDLDYHFSMETYETNKEILIQTLAYRAVEVSNLAQMTEESRHRVSLMSAEEAGVQWMKDHPKLAAGMNQAAGWTGIIGNIVKGSVSGVVGKWSK